MRDARCVGACGSRVWWVRCRYGCVCLRLLFAGELPSRSGCQSGRGNVIRHGQEADSRGCCCTGRDPEKWVSRRCARCGYMAVHEFADKGVVCGQTWGSDVPRGRPRRLGHDAGVQGLQKGSVFNKLSSAARVELVVSGGQPGCGPGRSIGRARFARLPLRHMLPPRIRVMSTADLLIVVIPGDCIHDHPPPADPPTVN